MKEPSYRYGKGWSVGCVRKKNPNFPYNAIAVKDGVPISAGCRATYEEAAKLTDIYNEDKTVLWLKRNGLEELIKKARVA